MSPVKIHIMTSYGGIIRIRLKGRSSITSLSARQRAPLFFVRLIIAHLRKFASKEFPIFFFPSLSARPDPSELSPFSQPSRPYSSYCPGRSFHFQNACGYRRTPHLLSSVFPFIRILKQGDLSEIIRCKIRQRHSDQPQRAHTSNIHITFFSPAQRSHPSHPWDPQSSLM